jgi:hypothetical protein
MEEEEQSKFNFQALIDEVNRKNKLLKPGKYSALNLGRKGMGTMASKVSASSSTLKSSSK